MELKKRTIVLIITLVLGSCIPGGAQSWSVPSVPTLQLLQRGHWAWARWEYWPLIGPDWSRDLNNWSIFSGKESPKAAPRRILLPPASRRKISQVILDSHLSINLIPSYHWSILSVSSCPEEGELHQSHRDTKLGQVKADRVNWPLIQVIGDQEIFTGVVWLWFDCVL